MTETGDVVHHQVESRDLWGDYGSILINGMSAHQERKRGLIQLERAGPFVPPLSLPGVSDVVVTAKFRQAMKASGLFRGVRFKEVIKARIVRLEWHTWDLRAEDPLEVPHGGEPEDYILGRPHDKKLAQEMGSLYEAILPSGGEGEQYDRKELWDYKVRVRRGTWDGSHLFRAGNWIFVDEIGQRWLETEGAGEWLQFEARRY